MEELHNSLKNCINSFVNNKTYKKTSDDVFTLSYGDPVVEVFNILSSYDIKTIEFLNNCVKIYDPSKFTFQHNNITNLHGGFEILLPEITKKIINGLAEAISESSWTTAIDKVEIKSIEYVSMTSHENIMSLTEYKNNLFEKMHSGTISIGYPFRFESEEAMNGLSHVYNKANKRIDLYDQMKELMTKPSECEYLAYIMLSDRYEYSGGSFYIEKNQQENVHEDEYDDEVQPDSIKAYHLDIQKTKLRFLHNNLFTEYTPERGELIAIYNIVKHYVAPISKGKRDYLIIQFTKL